LIKFPYKHRNYRAVGNSGSVLTEQNEFDAARGKHNRVNSMRLMDSLQPTEMIWELFNGNLKGVVGL
jgi:hypothetical protein